MRQHLPHDVGQRFTARFGDRDPSHARGCARRRRDAREKDRQFLNCPDGYMMSTAHAELLARAAMRAVVKQMREFADRRCVSPADQLSIGDAAKVMLDAYVRKAGIDE